MVVMRGSRLRLVTGLVAGLVAGLVLAGCGTDEPVAAAGSGRASGAGGLELVASFYPLQYVAERVAGDTATVTGLTKPGTEPHDLELTPKDVASLGAADVVVYLSGFQPAVDEAVAQEAKGQAFDTAKPARLDLSHTPIEDGREATDEAGSTDPHFWLDPIRLADVAEALVERLAELAPDQAATYQRNAATLRAELAKLDAELAKGLARCVNRKLVTSHNAFGYLAARYGLEQLGITGLTPEEEPSPADLAAVSGFVRAHDVQTIYSETLVSPAIARTVARETGAATAVLDPVEGLSEDSAGEDYLAVMRANLASLRKGQRCR
jgi:zinc transport system substrate-binding protein